MNCSKCVSQMWQGPPYLSFSLPFNNASEFTCLTCGHEEIHEVSQTSPTNELPEGLSARTAAFLSAAAVHGLLIEMIGWVKTQQVDTSPQIRQIKMAQANFRRLVSLLYKELDNHEKCLCNEPPILTDIGTCPKCGEQMEFAKHLIVEEWD